MADEKKTSVDITVEAFDSQTSYLELPEELDEKVVSYIEREIRHSYEYKNYITYLKTELNLTSCSLMPGLDSIILPVSLEFHHFPLTLFEIVQIVGLSMIDNLKEGEKVSCFDIAEQVMKEHYQGNIGLVPLSVTMHEMAHNKSIVIPLNKVNGNYKKFLTTYDKYISDDIKNKIKEEEIDTISEEAKKYNATKLEKNIINYNITYKKEDKDE
jgi:hypothetical protein